SKNILLENPYSGYARTLPPSVEKKTTNYVFIKPHYMDKYYSGDKINRIVRLIYPDSENYLDNSRTT
ncbi:MAG: hypothetical protein ACOCWG_05240, partial [bacterium]